MKIASGARIFWREHHWVVLSSPELDPDDVVMVSLSSIKNKPYEDKSCTIQANEDPAIKKDSFVRYDLAVRFSEAKIGELVKKGEMTVHSPIRAEVVERIRKGAKSSLQIPQGCRNVLIDQGLI